MSCDVLQKAILHSCSVTIFNGVFWYIVNMVGAASEVTNRNAAGAVGAPQLLTSPVSMGPALP